MDVYSKVSLSEFGLELINRTITTFLSAAKLVFGTLAGTLVVMAMIGVTVTRPILGLKILLVLIVITALSWCAYVCTWLWMEARGTLGISAFPQSEIPAKATYVEPESEYAEDYPTPEQSKVSVCTVCKRRLDASWPECPYCKRECDSEQSELDAIKAALNEALDRLEKLRLKKSS